MKNKKRSLFLSLVGFIVGLVIGWLVFGCMKCMIYSHYTNKSTTSVANEDNVNTIILNVLNNESDFSNPGSHLSDDEFCIVQEFVREHEEELKDYNPMKISNEYSIIIDRETRALCARNSQDMTRRLTWRTIDCNNYSEYDKFISQNDRTYCLGKNVIAEYYLGEEIAKYNIPVENPVILSYYMDDVVITDNNMENSILLLCGKNNKCIQISNSFSQLPVDIYMKGLYYIDSNQILYMYNLCTGENVYIAKDVYYIFRTSGLNFRSREGLFKITIFVSEDGNFKNIESKKIDSKIEKWP